MYHGSCSKATTLEYSCLQKANADATCVRSSADKSVKCSHQLLKSKLHESTFGLGLSRDTLTTEAV